MTTAYYLAGTVASAIAILRFGVVPVIRAAQVRAREHRQLVADVAALATTMASLAVTVAGLAERTTALEGKHT